MPSLRQAWLGSTPLTEELALALHVPCPADWAHGKNRGAAVVLTIAYADHLHLVAEFESVCVAWV